MKDQHGEVFNKKIIENGGKDKDYLKCLKLINKHGKELITIAMELSLEEGGEEVSALNLSKIITNNINNIEVINPIRCDLDQYDYFLTGEKNGSKFKSKS